MKKLLFIALAMTIISQAFAGWTRQLEEAGKTQTQREESLLQTLSNLPVFSKLKEQLSEQFPGVFDSIAQGDVSGLITALGSKVQDLLSGSFKDLNPAIKDIKPQAISIEDLRNLKSALDDYAKGKVLFGRDESLNPQLKQIYNSVKDTYKKLAALDATVVSKGVHVRNQTQELLEKLFYSLIEGETPQDLTPVNKATGYAPQTAAGTSGDETINSLVDAIKSLFGGTGK